MGKESRLKELKESYEAGIVKKEEYLSKKKEIEEEKDAEEESPKRENEDIKPGVSSDKILIVGIIIVIAAFVIGLLFVKMTKEEPKTIEELHELNLIGKLDPELGYLYKDAYSFINLEGFWYTQLTSSTGRSLYDMSLRYSPRDLEDIVIFGNLNTELFNNATDYYATFNPTGSDFSHVAVAISDFNQHMVKVFNKMPIAACDRNETEVCKDRPIVDCDNTDKIVLYVKEANQSRVIYDGNCILIEGNGLDLVRGVDRVLLNFYGIMER